jgi:hypothetical protein
MTSSLAFEEERKQISSALFIVTPAVIRFQQMGDWHQEPDVLPCRGEHSKRSEGARRARGFLPVPAFYERDPTYSFWVRNSEKYPKIPQLSI